MNPFIFKTVSTFALCQESSNYGKWTKFGPLLVFVNEVQTLEHGHVLFLICYL